MYCNHMKRLVADCTYLSCQEVALCFHRQLFVMMLDEKSLLKTQNTVELTSITTKTDNHVETGGVVSFRKSNGRVYFGLLWLEYLGPPLKVVHFDWLD